VQQQRAVLGAVLETLHVPEDAASDAAAKLQTEARRLAREAHELRTKLATGGGRPDGAAAPVEIKGIPAIIRRVEGVDKAGLRDVSDSLKSALPSGVVVLASATPDGKVAIVVSVTPDLKDRLHAGRIVKEIAPLVGGGGGGRPDFAEAGGKDPSKLDALLERSRLVIERMAAAG
jgi:alanyl-tRNA synthetase